MEILLAYINTPDNALAEKLTAKEKEADEARRILIDELLRTFITPFDREDIFALSRAIDDVLDYADTTITEIAIFKVKPSVHMAQICTLLRDATFELLKAVECLQEHPMWRLNMPTGLKSSRTRSKLYIVKPWQKCSRIQTISRESLKP